MSDTGDSDDSSIEKQLNYKRRVNYGKTFTSNDISNNNSGKKRKIIMKIESDDSDSDDEDDENTDISYSDEENNNELSNDEVKPSNSNRKRLLETSDDESDNSNNSEIIRYNSNVRGRIFDKNPISEEDEDIGSPKSLLTIKDEDGFNSDSSSNDAIEKCPICLLSFRNQEIATPNICEHRFCALCIEEWSKNVQTCPIDRKEFTTIIVYDKFKNKKHELKVIKQIDDKQDNVTNDDITCCEICHLSNREDVMLLCDGCNQGFHIFCLTPQLEQIPDGFWFCEHCHDSDQEEDLSEELDALYEEIRGFLGIQETRLRITELRQPRVLRTRQSERIRANIAAQARSRNSNNNTTEIDITAPSTSRALIEHSINGGGRRRLAQTTTTITTTTTTALTTKRGAIKRKPVTRKRNTIRRKRRKTKKSRSKTYVVEYDVNNYDDKFALKTTKKYIRKRRTKRKSKIKRKARLTNSYRIMPEQLEQKNGKKIAAEQMGLKRLTKFERPINPSQTLSLFGNANDLEYFSDDENNFQENEFNMGSDGGSIAVQTSVRFGNISNLRHRKGIKPNIQPSSTNPVDLLSNLLDMQDRFFNSTRQTENNAVKIGSDGSINFLGNFFLNSTRQNERNAVKIGLDGSINFLGNQDNSEKKNDKLNENQVNSNDINQAPMFPWNNNQRNNNVGQGRQSRGGGGGSGGGGSGGGNGGNYNNRFNNQSDYRSNSGGGNYRHSTGGIGNQGNNNFRFQNQNNNQNFTPNYRDRFNRNNQRNRRNQNNSVLNNDNNNEVNPNFNNNSSNIQLNSPANYNDDSSNQTENINNLSIVSPQEEQLHSSPPRIITSEEVSNSILALKPSTSANDPLEDNYNLNRNTLNPPSLHVPSLHMPPPLNFTPLHYRGLNQPPLTSTLNHPPPLTPTLNHPPPLMGSLINTIGGSIIESISSNMGGISGPNIGPVIDFSQPPPPPPPPPPEEDQNKLDSPQKDQQATTPEYNSTFIGPQPLVPPPWNENLFKLATDYCDDDNDDDCPNFSVYSAESLQVANSTITQNVQGDTNKEDEFDADEDLVQLGDDDDIPNSIDNSENRNRIEFKITGPKIYKPDKKVDEKRENKYSLQNNEEQIKTKSTENLKNDDMGKKIENDTSEKDDNDENSNQNNDFVVGLNDDDDDDDESSNNELTPVTYNDLEKPTNETDTDTTTTTPLINLKNKKGILELYDDSDWEELNIEREQLKQKIAMENNNSVGPQFEKDDDEDELMNKDSDDNLEVFDTNKMKENIGDEKVTDRSYTPCLDEKNDHDDVVQILQNSPPTITSSSFEKKNEDTEKDESGIDGIETELISDGEMIVGEPGKNGKKKEDRKKSDDKNDGKNLKKTRRNEPFKKITKNQRERNYRGERVDAIRERTNRHSRSRSRSNDKENKDREKNRRSRERRNSKNRFRRVKRKEIVRYNVRNIINQPRTYKDRYGRDTSRTPKSRSRSRPIRMSRSRSRSYIRSPIRSRSNSRSRSLSSVRKNVRSFSISPSPLSPQGYRGRRPFSPRHVRRISPIARRRSRTPPRMRSRSQSRSRSRSNSVSDRGTAIGDRRRHSLTNRIRQRSLSVSSKSKSPQAYTPAPKRSGSVIKNRKRKRSKERRKRKIRRRNSPISSPPQQQLILQHSKRLSRPRERTSPNIASETVASNIGVTGNRKKKSRRSRTKSPVIDRVEVQHRGWTTSPEYNLNEKTNNVSWTPPIQSPPEHSEFRVLFKEPKKKRDKKKIKDKRKERNSGGNNRKEKRTKNKDKTPQAPSKEVFASGDNILVSVSFNKDNAESNVPPQQTTVVTLPPTRAEIVSNRRQSSTEKQRSRRNKDQSTNQIGPNQQRQRKHRKINIKPVAIIDLDRSPFQVIQVPRDIIVLTDSDNENDQRHNPEGVDGSRENVGRRSSSVCLDNDGQQQQLITQLQQQEQQHRENSINRSMEINDDDENAIHHRHHHENGHHRLREIDDDDDDEDDDEINNNKTPERKSDRLESNLPDDSYAIQQMGPKTPPEPPIVKFALSTKYRIKPRNPLHEEQEREEQQELEEERERERERERQEMEKQQLLQQQQQQMQQQQHQVDEQEIEIQQQQNITKIGPNTPPESGPFSPDVYDPFDPTKSPSVSPESQFLEEDELPSHSTISEKDLTNSESILDRERTKLDKSNVNPADLVKALMNTSQDLSKLKKSDQQYSSISNNNIQTIDNDNLITEEQQLQPKTVQVLSNVLLSLGKSHHHIPLISSPPQSSSSLKPQQSQGFMGITKLPQNMSNKPSTVIVGSNSNNYRHNGGSNDDNMNEVDSPYSPCSDDFDDLFDPPPETSSNNRNRNRNVTKSAHKYTTKTVEMFDDLFGSTSPVGIGNNRLPGLGGFASSSARKQKPRTNKKTPVKVAKIPGVGKIDEEQIKIYDDLPNSAVELQVKDKFLRKLNRQERVVEEVKLVLKPHYNRKHISKDEYKEILRRSVPKICHSRSGEINPSKIHTLIEAYVKKFRQRNKLGIGMNTGQVSTAVKCAAYLKKL